MCFISIIKCGANRNRLVTESFCLHFQQNTESSSVVNVDMTRRNRDPSVLYQQWIMSYELKQVPYTF